MRIARLIASGDDRVGRQTSGAQNSRVDFRAQYVPRSGLCPTIPAFVPCPASTCFSTSIPRAIPASVISSALRIRRSSDFRLRFALRPEKAVRWLEPDFFRFELRAKPSGKFAGTSAERTFLLRQKMREHFFVGRRLGARSLHFFFKRAVGQNLVRLRLFASAIDLEIAQDERSLAVLFEKNKGIGREKTRRVKHVGVDFRSPRRSGGFCLFEFFSFR